MLRIYKEHPEFGEYAKFNTETGRLTDITADEFKKFLTRNTQLEEDKGKIIDRKATVFMGETSETHTMFPRRIYFQITRNCNLSCDYCFIKSKRGDPHVPTSAIMEIASFLGRNGLMEVRLTGGEPTTHPNFIDIVHRFQEENVYVSIATNGVIKKRLLDKLCELRNVWLICSIDGSREIHNRYRPYSFDHIFGNLRYLKNKNPLIRLRLTTVLTKENMGQMHELGEISKSVDAESITVIPLRPQVRDPGMKSEMVTAQEFRQVIKNLVNETEKQGIRFTTTIETDYKDKIYKDPVFRKKSSCAAGREGTNLDYDVKENMFIVYGCSYSPAVDFDVDPRIRKPFLAGKFPIHKVEKFLDIWKDDNAWTLFRDLTLKANDCKECEYLAKHQCVGSCPIQNIDYSRITVNKNLMKQLREQIHSTSEWYCYKRIME